MKLISFRAWVQRGAYQQGIYWEDDFLMWNELEILGKFETKECGLEHRVMESVTIVQSANSSENKV